MSIPVIDVFAGPGGLGEGFSSLLDENGKRIFRIVLSVEKDKYAHQTLTLRSFYRQFDYEDIPEDYYDVLRGKLTINELYENWPKGAELAKEKSWKAKLGYDEESEEPKEVDCRIKKALGNEKDWILIGGPPCQAYSVVGRSRRQEKILDEEKDDRVDLYKQYLRIIETHQPTAFIMENVKGMLSARSKSNSIFEKIMEDLKTLGYKVFSLVKEPHNNLFNKPEFEPGDFVIQCEKYGIPQTRHRVILLGIREDSCSKQPDILEEKSPISISKVIDDLPRLRSGLSKQKNSWENWSSTVSKITLNGVMGTLDDEVAGIVKKTVKNLRNPHKNDGKEFVETRADYIPPEYKTEWFHDERIGGVCNHVSRGHMGSDLHRYLFASAYAKVKGRSPKLEDFPKDLLPNHKNVKEAIKTKKFADRFRVQLEEKPSKTITSHISKDGHYYIHYDPSQCRSLTVREAARIQTFPDNYFFCGPRTSQYIQVGNAVPPLLANNIAVVVFDLFKSVIKEDEYVCKK
jgi:DNA (cytosine-5)-methyltransferase 1